MRLKKSIIAIISCFALTIAFSNTNAVAENYDAEESIIISEPEEIQEVECSCSIHLAGTQSTWNPVCEHGDPTSWLHPHSSMRYVRTVEYYNDMEHHYETRDWYQCIFCGYETFFVHGIYY